jgi:hypothetical protein
MSVRRSPQAAFHPPRPVEGRRGWDISPRLLQAGVGAHDDTRARLRGRRRDIGRDDEG